MRLIATLLVLLSATVAPAQTELKWKWKQDQAFWVQTTTQVDQSLIIEDMPALKIPADYKPDDRPDRQSLEQIIRICRAEPAVRGVLSRRVGAAFAAIDASGSGPLSAVGLMTPFRLAWEREIRQSYKHTSFVRYFVKKRNEDGSAILIQRIEKDRTVLAPAPRGDNPEVGLDEVELTLHVDSRGVVTKVEGAGEALLRKVAGDDSERRKALEAALSEETIQASATQALGLFPDKSINSGDTWTRSATMQLGALGLAKLDRAFSFEGIRTTSGVKMADVKIVSRLADYRAAPELKTLNLTALALMQSNPTTAASALSAAADRYSLTQVATANWTTAEGRTDLEIDIEAGRPTEAKSTLTLAGFLTLANAGTTYRGRVTMRQIVTTKLLDKLPAVEKMK